MRTLVSLMLILSLGSACTPITPPSVTAPVGNATPSQTPIPNAIQPTDSVVPTMTLKPRSLEAAVADAKADLATRLGRAIESIKVISTQSDEFPAGDLGCGTPLPQPALVTGWRIILEVETQRYEYRAAGTQRVYCGPR